MRVSTSMVYDVGVRTMNAQTANLLHLQQQVATGRRIVSPSDDPVASARILELTQASDVVAQFATNRDNAQGALALQETQLDGVGQLLTRVRELAIQGGNGTLTRENRMANTAELRARFEELLGYANTRDGSGNYLFSGYMGNTRPFGGTVETGAQYFGDDGQRQLQVSPSRVIEISDSGKEIFQRIKNGNGSFVTGVNNANTGTAVVDGGAVLDPTKWADPNNSGRNYEVQFWVDSGAQLTQPGKTYYDIVDVTDPLNPLSVNTGAAPDSDPTSGGFSFGQEYNSGHAIALFGPGAGGAPPPTDLGANIIITGAPKSGDSFSIQPSTTQDIFDTLRTLILDLEDTTANDAQNALLSNRVGFALTNLDQAEQSILRVRALIGSRLQEVESLQGINEDMGIQYQQAISNLQDLDYAKTYSDLTRKEVDLQAAQQSFLQVSKLSLFNYL